MTQAIDNVEHIYSGNITLDIRSHPHSVSYHDEYTWRGRIVNMLPVYREGYRTVKNIISEGTLELNPNPGRVLYIEPKARINRDILRQSGYTITRDPDKADRIIIPALMDNQTKTYSYNLVLHDSNEKTLYLIDLYRNSRYYDVEQSDLDLIANFVSQRFPNCTMYGEVSWKSKQISFIPKIQSYVDIINKTYPFREYTIDSEVKFIPTTELNVDTLEVWSHFDAEDNNDLKILEKCISGCDWQKYPFTLVNYIIGEFSYAFDYVTSANAKMVLENIQYHNVCRGAAYEGNITPEDWDLFQSWIMHKLNIKDSSGWISTDQFYSLSATYRKYVRSKMAVSAMQITSPDCVTNIEAKL